MNRIRFVFAVATVGISLLFLCLPSVSALEDKDCLDCHDGSFDVKLYAASVHGSNKCTSCHTDIKEIPHAESLAKVDCSACHPGELKEFKKSIHWELFTKDVPDIPTCASCHGTHDIFPKTDDRSHVNHFRIEEICLRCHGDKKIVDRHPLLPDSEYVERYKSSIHGRGVHDKGLLFSSTCIDCHGTHEIRPSSDPESTVFQKNIPTTCKKCHLAIYWDFEKSVHGQLWKAGLEDGPVCTTCHKGHGVEEVGTKSFQINIPNECGGCHQERVLTYTDTFHGKATSLGFIVSAKCSDCHTSHSVLPKSDPKSAIHPDRLVKTCGKCHDRINKNFVEYNPHLGAHNEEKFPLVHFVVLFMEWLLILVFGFWGVHTLLWLQRSIVAMIRKEVPKEEALGKHIRRFSKGNRVLHATVAISFLGLVLTGIPLKYHTSLWAKMLGNFIGGIEVSRYFHRLFAVITFGYFAFHLANIFYRFLVKREKGLFFGLNSLVPRWKDIVDFYHNVKWFFYLGPPPGYGRWTYFEKFDYYAVFWGVPIIGLSGLVMWFPAFFTQLLPGSILNIAAIIHSDEALLALGFIFTFHFFHNHMRPENFPMDVSIFTGTISLERFMRERPEEYESLKKSGKLENFIVDAPAPNVVFKCKVFGFILLGVGLVLVAAIYATFIYRLFY